jgi:tetratricopeptide (TPR) repeat protein
MGFLDKAEEEFKKVTADPSYASKELPYYNLARLYSMRQNWETALFFVDKAIQANARYHLGHGLRGYILENEDKIPEAIESYKQAVKLLPGDVTYNGQILDEILPLITNPEMKEKADSYLKTIKEKEKGSA